MFKSTDKTEIVAGFIAILFLVVAVGISASIVHGIVKDSRERKVTKEKIEKSRDKQQLLASKRRMNRFEQK